MSPSARTHESANPLTFEDPTRSSLGDDFNLPPEFLATLGLDIQDPAVNFDLWPAAGSGGLSSSVLDFDFASFHSVHGSYDGAI